MSEKEFNDYNEIIYERDKLKEQNEKLKEALNNLRGMEAWIGDREMIRVFQKNVYDTLKSCES